jgi:uncharacterized membrane protein
VLLVVALAIATTGFLPGVNDPEVVLKVMLASLAAEVILLPLTILSGFARDSEAKTNQLASNAIR